MVCSVFNLRLQVRQCTPDLQAPATARVGWTDAVTRGLNLLRVSLPALREGSFRAQWTGHLHDYQIVRVSDSFLCSRG